MLMPSIFGENLFDDLLGYTFDDMDRQMRKMDRQIYGRNAKHEMKTDVREHEDGYELDMDLPGFKKDQIELNLENGYLTVTATKGFDKDEKDKQGRMIRQERYAGSMQRSFYVGDAMTSEDVKARFEDGVLHLTLPKKDAKKVPEKKTICIEG
ncbi:MAG: Hsp20/alpha crystallin family protein [Clostridiales bacterium]|nr:Hsp20/alpha crystallin family protein [Clostridiales bacterium]